MSTTKSLSAQIKEIEAAQEKLSHYEKLFDKACLINFNYNAKNIQKLLNKNEECFSDFEKKIRTFFNLKTDKDVADFLTIMCTEYNLNFFKNKLEENRL